MPKGAWTESSNGGPGGSGGGGWSCAYCYATGRAIGGDSDGACGAVRLMESLRQGMQNAVRVRACVRLSWTHVVEVVACLLSRAFYYDSDDRRQSSHAEDR